MSRVSGAVHAAMVLPDLIDLVLPGSCVGCRRSGPPLCAVCAEPDIQEVHLDGLRVAAAARYEGAIRTALLAYKERDRRDLARPLAGLLAAALSDTDDGAVIVPMPTSAAARRIRGGDRVRRLAAIAARHRGEQVCLPLHLTRSVQDSAGLDIAARAANLHEAMAAAPPGRYTSAVIVDDIVTTGASLLEARRALCAAGWHVGGAAVVAATPRRRPVTAAGSGPSSLPHGSVWQVVARGSNVRVT